MKKLLLTLILGIFLISLATASIADLGNFQRFDCIDLPQTCPDCTYNNISKVTNAESITVSTEVVMQRDGTYYNYTFCNTTTLGEYIVNGYGDEGGTKDTWEYKLTVTETGTEDKPIWDNSLLLILITMALIFLLIGIKTGTVWLGFMSAVMFLLGGIYMTIYGLNNITNMYTQGIGITIIGVGIVIFFVSVYEGFLDD